AAIDVLGAEQHAPRRGRLADAVAPRDQPGAAEHEQVAPRDHAPSSGTRHQPVTIERTSLNGPARITNVRCTTTNSAISVAAMKWIERAEGRPPNRSSSQGRPALRPGDKVSPVRISKGSSTNSTAA